MSEEEYNQRRWWESDRIKENVQSIRDNVSNWKVVNGLKKLGGKIAGATS
jgi:hypothetical protein